MITTFLPLMTALMLGFLHALEVDHMIAVTTFVTGRPALGDAARFGFRWGVGHSAAVMIFGGVLLVTGIKWPDHYDALGRASSAPC
jgi:high-affinity nickel permease